MLSDCSVETQKWNIIISPQNLVINAIKDSLCADLYDIYIIYENSAWKDFH